MNRLVTLGRQISVSNTPSPGEVISESEPAESTEPTETAITSIVEFVPEHSNSSSRSASSSTDLTVIRLSPSLDIGSESQHVVNDAGDMLNAEQVS